MTPEQVDLIRKSFDAMWPIRRDIADLCYSRFFELAPDARDLFAGDMERQRVKLMDMIAARVGSLDEHPLFQSMVTNSGRTHARFGVQPSQYVAMGEALMWSLDCKFGASFTPGAAGSLEGILRHSADRDAARGRRDLDRQGRLLLSPNSGARADNPGPPLLGQRRRPEPNGSAGASGKTS